MLFLFLAENSKLVTSLEDFSNLQNSFSNDPVYSDKLKQITKSYSNVRLVVNIIYMCCIVIIISPSIKRTDMFLFQSCFTLNDLLTYFLDELDQMETVSFAVGVSDYLRYE